MRERHTTSALASASVHSQTAFQALLSSDDEFSLGRLRRVVESSPAYLAAVRAHPNPRIRAVGEAVALTRTGARRLRDEARRAGRELGASGVHALLSFVRVGQLRGDGERFPRWVLEGLLSPEGRAGGHSWETLASILEEHVHEWELGSRLTVAIVESDLAKRERAVMGERVLEATRWLGLSNLAVAASPDALMWGKCSLDSDDSVVALRRILTDELVEAHLRGEQWAETIPAARWSSARMIDADAEALRGERPRAEGVVTEAVRQSILAHASEHTAAALSELAGRLGVEMSRRRLLDSSQSVEGLQSLIELAGASAWRSGQVEAGMVEALVCTRSRPRGEAGRLWAQMRAELGGGVQPRAAVEALVSLARACSQNPDLEEEHGEDLSEALALGCTDLQLEWELAGELVAWAWVEPLDEHAGDLERSEAGDERFVELASHVPYICDASDLGSRRRPAGVARKVLGRLSDPGFSPRGMMHSEESLSHWRGVALMNCCEQVKLRIAEIETLPWRQVSGERTQEAIGSYLAKRLGDEQGRWEVLAGIGDSFEGSVGELVEAVLACSS